MSRADEYAKWARELANAPIDDLSGTSAEAELAWRAMNAIVEQMEGAVESCDAEDVASQWAQSIQWAAFWVSAGAVIVAAILRFA